MRLHYTSQEQAAGNGQITTNCTFNDDWRQHHWYAPSLRGLRIEFVYQCGLYGLKLRGQLGVDLE
jgi:hypothetical protein